MVLVCNTQSPDAASNYFTLFDQEEEEEEEGTDEEDDEEEEPPPLPTKKMKRTPNQ